MTTSKYSLSRRSFLASTSAMTSLFFIPAHAFADDPSDVVFRGAVMSDIHYSGNLDAKEVKRFETAIPFMYDYSSKQPYNKFDALIVCGDMTNNGIEKQLRPFKNSIDKCLKPETKQVICMGNHEFYGGNTPLWENIMQLPANNHQVINGYHFITLSPKQGKGGTYSGSLDWLKKQLDEACSEDPKKPVFLMQHYHVSYTVYGSVPPDSWGNGDIAQLLKNYPNLIDFSGHSHYPVNDPRSAWQGEYTAFGTGTLSYYEMAGGKFTKWPKNYDQAAEFYVMEIHRDNSVVLKLYDLITNSFYNCVYLVTEPGNVDKFLYTSKRAETAKAPYWNSDVAITVDNVTGTTAKLSFPQASWDEQDSICTNYRFVVERKMKNEDKWVLEYERYPWSEYYFANMPKTMVYDLDSLDGDTDYRVTVNALNCFENASEKALTVQFKTLPDPENPYRDADTTATNPVANVLDIHFTEKEAVNTAVNKLERQKPLEVFGTPALAQDATVGCVTATFNGSSAYCARFSEFDYKKLSKTISMTAKFQFDQFPKGAADIFANTEQGGYCLELNGTKKQIEFWCHIAGRYVIVSAPVNPGEYITACGVYDGTQVILYLNGKQVASTKASGQITYTRNGNARAICVGADIHGNGKPTAYFTGKVAFAKLFSWALSPVQVENLSK